MKDLFRDVSSFAPLGLVAAVVMAAGFGGCARSLDDLKPFPCPAEKRCPAGLVCDETNRCVDAYPLAPCLEDETECGTAGEDFRCRQGICATSCSEDRDCAGGSICVGTPNAISGALDTDGAGGFRYSNGACLPRCGGASCPVGTVCTDLHDRRRSACMVEGSRFPYCIEFEGESCSGSSFACGASAFTVSCGGGSSCPQNSTCQFPGCACNVGYEPYRCSGSPCNGGCTDTNYGCRPTSELPPSCGGSVRNFTGSCLCADGSQIAISQCTVDGSCEQFCIQRIDGRDGG